MKKRFLFFLIALLSFSTLNAQWETCNNGLKNLAVNTFAISGNNIIAGGGGIFLSSDNGNTWTETFVEPGIEPIVNSLSTNGDNIYVGSLGGGLFISTDKGENWTPKDNGLLNLYVMSIAMSGINIFAGTWDGGVFMSEDNCNSWVEKNNGLSDFYINTITLSGNNLFVGTHIGIFLSTNNGDYWVQKDSVFGKKIIASLATSGNNIFAGTQGKGIYLSTDNGDNWIAKNKGLTALNINTIIAYKNNIFAGTDSSGIFLSTDNGDNWTAINKGISNMYISAFLINDNYIFAGGWGGVYRAKLSGFGISDVHDKVLLTQNTIYPNPASDFLNINSANIIGKDIIIYDMLGNKIISVTAAGAETRINIESLQTGVYLIKIGEQTKMFVKN